MRFQGIRGVTFDAGGTLIAPNPGVGAIYADVAATHGVVAEPEVLDARFRVAFKHIRNATGAPVSDESERTFWRALARGVFMDLASAGEFDRMFPDLWNAFAQARRWRLQPGVLESLERLRNAGLRLSVLSNFDSRLHKILAGLSVAPFFEHTFISAEVGVAKPGIGIFAHAERTLGLRAGQLLHVGDSADADAAGAVAAGWSAVLIGREHPGAITIAELCELPAMVG